MCYYWSTNEEKIRLTSPGKGMAWCLREGRHRARVAQSQVAHMLSSCTWRQLVLRTQPLHPPMHSPRPQKQAHTSYRTRLRRRSRNSFSWGSRPGAISAEAGSHSSPSWPLPSAQRTCAAREEIW